jgi:hypothetical protein
MSPEHYSRSKMREPFYFMRSSFTPDGQGGRTDTPVRSPASGYHFCQSRPLRGAERPQGEGINAQGALQVVVYKSLGILVTDTLYKDGVAYNIRLVHPAPRDSVFQELEVERGVPL